MNDVTLSGMFRLMQGDTELAAQCDDDVYLSQNQVNELNQLLQQERGFDLSDDRLTVQWRFTVTTGNDRSIPSLSPLAMTFVLSSGMTVFSKAAPIRFDSMAHRITSN